MKFRIIFSCLTFLITVTSLFGQLEGKITSTTGEAAVGVGIEVIGLDKTAQTNASGIFRIPDLDPGDYMIQISSDEYGTQQVNVTKADFLSIFNVELEKVLNPKNDKMDEIAIITDLELLESDDSEVASLLTASRDPFNNVAAFNFRAARFRIRGYNNIHNEILVNGISFNSINRGNAFFGTWGGLNDMFRARDETQGLAPASFAIGGIGGATNLDIRASRFRSGLKASYSAANASYRNRLMLTYATGVSDNGWSFGASLSKRWAEEGYVTGTFYDGYSGFFGVEKQFSNNHSIGLSVFSVNTIRGRSSASTQEAYDLAGDNFYNPNWGWLNGEIKNPRQYRNNLHTAILRYDNTINKSKITSTAGFQFGKDGGSGIDWYEAPDPRPDYYRKLPSFSDVPEVRDLVTDYLSSNPELLQLDLEGMYESNNNRVETIQSVDGITGNDVTGKLAAYKIQEQRYDPTKIFFNTVVNTAWTDRITTNSGINITSESIDNFKVVDDLLGADFAIDWDNFADISGDQTMLIDPAKQNNILAPNNILDVGDVFGYHYQVNHIKTGAWSQAEISLNKIDFFVAGGADYTTFYREGLFQNGRFPDNSLGKGKTKKYLTGTAKAGLTYKINGRNYIYANGAYLTKAPNSRNSYVTPRTRATLIDGLEVNKITSGEIGYVARFPGFKARATAYYTQMLDQFETRNVYFDQLNEFGNLILNDVDTRHMGIEIGADMRLSSAWSGAAGLALGDHRYTNNPSVQVAIDDNVAVQDLGTTYFRNRFVSGGPQTAATAEITYSNPKFWSVSLGANYFDKNFISMSPVRRLESRVGDILQPQLSALDAIDATSLSSDALDELLFGTESNPSVYDDLFGQEQYPRAFTFDAFFRKTYKKDKFYISLLASVNNITNNIFRSGGFEQLRYRYREEFDEANNLELVNLFPPRYYYAYGTTYFITLSVSYD